MWRVLLGGLSRAPWGGEGFSVTEDTESAGEEALGSFGGWTRPRRCSGHVPCCGFSREPTEIHTEILRPGTWDRDSGKRVFAGVTSEEDIIYDGPSSGWTGLFVRTQNLRPDCFRQAGSSELPGEPKQLPTHTPPPRGSLCAPQPKGGQLGPQGGPPELPPPNFLLAALPSGNVSPHLGSSGFVSLGIFLLPC